VEAGTEALLLVETATESARVLVSALLAVDDEECPAAERFLSAMLAQVRVWCS
jgi:hypothetical protein